MKTTKPKYKELTKADISKLSLDKSKAGFTVWVTENGIRHWLIDGSDYTQSGEVKLASNTISGTDYKFRTIYDKKSDSIRIVKYD